MVGGGPTWTDVGSGGGCLTWTGAVWCRVGGVGGQWPAVVEVVTQAVPAVCVPNTHLHSERQWVVQYYTTPDRN